MLRVSSLRNLFQRSSRRNRRRLLAELLEDRTLLAAVSWDGGAGTHGWNDANNWSNNAVPTINDDVTVSNATVSLSTPIVTNSLTLNVATLNVTGGFSIATNNLEIGSTSNINAGSNTLTIKPKSAGRSINIGGAESQTWQLVLTDAELDRISAETLIVGDNTSGWIPVTAAITQNKHLSLKNNGGYTIKFPVTMTANKNFSVSTVSPNDALDFWSSNAQISTTGTGSISLSAKRNITVNTGTSLTTVNGGISLQSNLLDQGIGNFNGLFVQGLIRTTGSGAITLEGHGGNDASASNQRGVVIDIGGVVESTSFSGGGSITLEGTGGSGQSGNAGVELPGTFYAGGGTVKSWTGDIRLTGYGRGSGDRNMGVSVYGRGSTVIANSSAKIEIEGYGAGWDPAHSTLNDAGQENHGVSIVASTRVSSSGGTVTIRGYGGEGIGYNKGVRISQSTVGGGGSGVSTIIGHGGYGAADGTVGGGNTGVEIYGDSSPAGISASAGGLSITGTGGVSSGTWASQSPNSNSGIASTGTVDISAGPGGVSVVGFGGSGENSQPGVQINGNSQISSSGGVLEVEGTGGTSTSTSYQSTGIVIEDRNPSSVTRRAAFIASGSADLKVTGTAGTQAGVPNASGILLWGGPQFKVVNGKMTVKGIAAGSGSGLNIVNSNSSVIPPVIFSSSGSGNMLLQGTAEGTTPGMILQDVRMESTSTLANAGRIFLQNEATPGDLSGNNEVRILGQTEFMGRTRIITDIFNVTSSYLTRFPVAITGNTPITEYDQFVTAGSVNVGGDLVVSRLPTFNPLVSDEFVIVNNTGDQPVTGQFNGLQEGEVLKAGDDFYVISYKGGDGNDVSLHRALIVTNTLDSGPGSLRQSLLDANAIPLSDVILFDIPGPGPHVISVMPALPAINDAKLQILGTYIDQVNGVLSPLQVEIRGNGQRDSEDLPIDGLRILAGDVFVRDLIVRNFSGDGISADVAESLTLERFVTGGNSGSGIDVGALVRNVTLDTVYSGLTTDGSAADANAEYGVRIQRDDTLLSNGAVTVDSSVVSGNTLGGLWIHDQRTAANSIDVEYLVRYSRFGLDVTGKFAVPNGGFGIKIQNDADAVQVPNSASRDAIIYGVIASGNDGVGLWMENTRGWGVYDSLFGTDLVGIYAIPNDTGILLRNVSSPDEIYDSNGNGLPDGGFGSLLVSGNRGDGIYLVFDSPDVIWNTWFSRLYVGVERDSGSGVAIPNRRGLVIDYDVNYSDNIDRYFRVDGLFSGNTEAGIVVNGTGGGTRLEIRGGIGTSGGEFGYANVYSSEAIDPLPNRGPGIVIASDDVQVQILPDTIIAFNHGPGIRHDGNGDGSNLSIGRRPGYPGSLYSPVEGPDHVQIYNNQGLSIDLQSPGPSENSGGSIETPVITSATLNNGFLDITGTNSASGGYFLQFYATKPTASGRGQADALFSTFGQLAGMSIPAAVTTYLADYPNPLYDQDLASDEFRFRINVGPDFDARLLTAVIVDPTLGKAGVSFPGVSEFSQIVSIGTQLTQLPPVVDAGGDELVIAGQALTRTITFRDDDSVEFQVVVDYGDGSGFEYAHYRRADRTITLDHAFTEVGTYVVSVSVLDDSAPVGLIDIGTFLVTVENTPPEIRFNEVALTKRVREGELVDLSGFFDDSNIADWHTVTVNWGDGTQTQQGPREFSQSNDAGDNPFSLTHIYRDDGVSRANSHLYRVVVNVTDEHGGVAETPVFLIEVDNVLPTIVSSSFNASTSLTSRTIDEGGTVTLFGQFTDPGVLDSHSIYVNWGDGSPRERVSGTQITQSGAGRSFQITHVFGDNPVEGSEFFVTWEVADDDDPEEPISSAASTLTVTVNNVAPTAEPLLLSRLTIEEGVSVALYVEFVDPGTETHFVLVNWGDGSEREYEVAAGLDSTTVVHQYLRDGVYTVSATVRDRDVAASPKTATLTVTNYAPVIAPLVLSATTINEGESVTVTGSFTDNSPRDTPTVMINWGDGTSSAARIDRGAGTFTATHRYDDGASTPVVTKYTITAAAYDETVTTNRTTTITVLNVAPTVNVVPLVDLTRTSSAFRALAYDPSRDDQASLTYSWSVTAGGFPVSFSQNSDGTEIEITGTLSSSVIVSLVVSDNDGASSDEWKARLIVGTSVADSIDVTNTDFSSFAVDQIIVLGLVAMTF